MKDDPETKLMLAHLENKRIEYATAYDQRGRAFASTPMEVLRRDWLAAFRAWAASARKDEKHDRRLLDDLEAEMYLRGTDPPMDLVPEEIQRLRIDEGGGREPARPVCHPRRSAQTW